MVSATVKEGHMSTLLLDIPTVAREALSGESTVRKWIREGRLPVVRLGRRVLVRRETFESFLTMAESGERNDSTGA